MATDQTVALQCEEMNRLTTELEQERTRRVAAEQAKKDLEQEIESLTSALFGEANSMVAAAWRETEASKKRNEDLTTQLSRQQQLREEYETRTARFEARARDVEAQTALLRSEQSELDALRQLYQDEVQRTGPMGIAELRTDELAPPAYTVVAAEATSAAGSMLISDREAESLRKEQSSPMGPPTMIDSEKSGQDRHNADPPS